MNNVNLFYSENLDVEQAYIITVKGNPESENYSKRCQESCDKVGMKYTVWDAFNGIDGPIQSPDHLKDDMFFRIFKITDHYMTRGEVACALSHISLWYECVKLDRPIVILEHDAIMTRKFTMFNAYNSIVYLGGAEWALHGWPIYPLPPQASDGPNTKFICRAHAYAIDPKIAKNLLAHVIKMGICSPLDIMIRVDLFNVTHLGPYAYDLNTNSTNDTTIKNRPTEGRTTKRNEGLAW
jgi:GR25 family glycosyltransferase involved in LPS biosynthesis